MKYLLLFGDFSGIKKSTRITMRVDELVVGAEGFEIDILGLRWYNIPRVTINVK